ncbi:MAG TPA: MFS transporter [Vicinamibacterales bacterium]|jgi:AAHS family 4-hydroxybenzoate transporter-like MFS transporter
MAPSQPIDIAALLDDGHWTARQKLFVLLTALTIIFDGIDNQLLGIAVPAMMREWQVARAAFAFVLAAGMIGMMVGGAVAGIVGDRLGRRVALVGSVVVFGVMTGAASLVDDLRLLAALRLLAGVGLGGAMPNAAALASEYVPRRHRPFAITLTIVCVPLGGTLAAFGSGYLLPLLGWRALFAIGGVLPLVIAAVLLRFLPESPRYLARHPDRWPELAGILRQIGHDVPPQSAFVDRGEKAIVETSIASLFVPEFRRDTLALWGAMFACMLAVYTGFNWVPTMITSAGLPMSVASNGLAAFNLGGVAGAICGGLVISRIGSRPTMLAMAAGAMAGAVVLSATPITAVAATQPIIVMLGFTGGLINAIQTTLYALAAHVYPTMVRATGVGTAVAFGRAGGVLSTFAGAWALDAGGSRAFFILMAGSMGIVFICLAIVKRHVPRR